MNRLNRQRIRTTLKLLLVLGPLFGLGWFTGTAWGQHLLQGGDTPLAYLPGLLRSDDTPETPPPPAEPPPTSDWLRYVNYHRALARLGPVTENPTWSEGDRQHACYMVQNDYVGHSQNTALPCASADGAAAAEQSNVRATTYLDAPDSAAVDYWMQTPFHSVAILDADLGEVGFGSFREAGSGWQYAAALDVGRGLDDQFSEGTTFPVMWPGDGSTTYLRAFPGYEWPAPLPHCGYGGYEDRAGLPLILQLGPDSVTPEVTAHALTMNGTPVEHCVFDETTFSHPTDPGQQWTGRIILNVRDAVVLIPRDPLTPGATYTASVTANGQTHTWSFAVAPDAYIMGKDLQVETIDAMKD